MPEAAIPTLAPEPDPRVVAAENRLPWVEDDEKALLSNGLAWAVTAMIGTFLGISIGLVAGILSPSELKCRRRRKQATP